MAKSKNPIPPGFHSVTPHLIVKGAAKYIDFLVNAFGATEVFRAPGPSGKLMHATVRFGDSLLMLADHFPEMGHAQFSEGLWPMVLNLYVPDADAAWARALGAGCSVVFPIARSFPQSALP